MLKPTLEIDPDKKNHLKYMKSTELSKEVQKLEEKKTKNMKFFGE